MVQLQIILSPAGVGGAGGNNAAGSNGNPGRVVLIYTIGDEPSIIGVNFQGTAANTNNLTTYTFNNFSIGNAFPGRRVVIVPSGTQDQGASINLTINGISATKHNVSGTNVPNERISLWSAIVSSGTTANISIQYNASALCCGIAVWTLSNSLGCSIEAIPNVLDINNNQSTANSITYTFNSITKGDVIIGAARIRDGNLGTYTFTGINEEYQSTVESAQSAQAGGSIQINQDSTNYDITATTTGSTPAWNFTVTRFYFP